MRKVSVRRLADKGKILHTSDLTVWLLDLPPLLRPVHDLKNFAFCEANLVQVLGIRSICTPLATYTVPRREERHLHA
jgi:hypothetical protein